MKSLLIVLVAFCLAVTGTYAENAEDLAKPDLSLFIAPLSISNITENEDVFDPDLFEGDMKLEPGQRLAAEFGFDVDGEMSRGAAIRSRYWPNGVVPYTIDSSLSSQSKAMQAIRAAMNTWSKKTCIRFVERTNEKGYIEFFKGSGCWSYVGRTGKKQQISLASGCWYKGTVAHEIAHALGFHHEQSRPDRDKHVTIKFENIQKGKSGNFKKYTYSTILQLGTPYDYGSVMHYGGKFFSKNGKPTIVPKTSGAVIGQRSGPSPIDVEEVNLLYQCSGKDTFGWCTDRYPIWCKNNARWCHWTSHMKGKCNRTCNFC
ncbi:zinc metalloproteinase nas-15-like [Oculina patagonica]